MIGAYLDGMRALVVGAIDQQAANASGAHLDESDLLLACGLGHAPLKRGPASVSNRPTGWIRNRTQTPPVADVDNPASIVVKITQIFFCALSAM